MTTNREMRPEHPERRVTRSRLLQAGATLALGALGAPLLSACGAATGSKPGANPTSAASAGTATTGQGGTGTTPTTSATSAGATPPAAPSGTTPVATQTVSATGTASPSAGSITEQLAAIASPIPIGGKPTGGEYHGYWPYSPPPQGQFNSFTANAITMGIYEDLMEMPFAIYEWHSRRYIPLMATSWEIIPPDKFRVHLRQGAKWSDGSDFTSKDVVTTFTITRMQNTPEWQYLGDIKALDDHTVDFTMAQPASVVPYFVLRDKIRAHSVYGKWAQRAQALFDKGLKPDSKEMSALNTEFSKFKLKEMVVSGPYRIDPSTITPSQLTMVKVPTAWNASVVNFDRIVLYNEASATAIVTIILDRKIDYATSGFSPATEQEMVKKGLRIRRPPVFSGPSLYMNFAKTKALADPRVRQAIARAIDKKQNGIVSLGKSGVASKYMTGVPDKIIEQWLDPSELAKMDSYAYDPERAASDLQKLGFRKQGGVWTSPKGERLAFEINAPAEWQDWSAAASNATDQLNQFGMRLTLRTVPFTQWPDMMLDGKFELGIGGWGTGNPHPYFSYYQDMLANTKPNASAGGINFDLVQNVPGLGRVDLRKLIEQSPLGLDTQKQRGTILELAKAFNYLLPIIPLWERYGNDPILENVRVTGWPPDSDPLWQNSEYGDNFTIIWILNGTLKGVRK